MALLNPKGIHHECIPEHIRFHATDMIRWLLTLQTNKRIDLRNVICLHHSFKNIHDKTLCPARTGCVGMLLDAYANHHGIILRPDDIWQMIITQFSFYLQARVEYFKKILVDFEKPKTLRVCVPGDISC
jgi:hypothetical protein